MLSVGNGSLFLRLVTLGGSASKEENTLFPIVTYKKTFSLYFLRNKHSPIMEVLEGDLQLVVNHEDLVVF